MKITKFDKNRDVKIYQDGKVSTAVERDHRYDGIDLILKRYEWVDPEWLEEQEKYLVNDQVVATVRCHEDDVYDEKVGRMEAIKKLNRMIMTQREAAVKLFESHIRKQMENPAAKKEIK